MYQNITISLPKTVISLLDKHIKNGNKSKFISDAVYEKITLINLDKKIDTIDQIERIFEKYGKKISQKDVYKSIRRGRM